MLNKLLELRQKYGTGYVTVLPDGQFIPWKPLPLSDYIQFQHDSNYGVTSFTQIENEVFKKCVLDNTLVRQLDFLKAGTVTTVAQNVWQYSGPTGINAFNDDLERARAEIRGDNVRAINDLVRIVTMAFSYTPDDVYAMDYHTFLLRVAQAEDKLLFLNAIEEPIQMVVPEEQKQKPMPSFLKGPQPSDPDQTFTSNRVDAKKLWDEQKRKRSINMQPSQERPPAPANRPLNKEKKWWDKSPVLEGNNDHNIDFRFEQAETDTMGMTGHEKADIHINRASMIEDAQLIYADVLEELAKKKKK